MKFRALVFLVCSAAAGPLAAQPSQLRPGLWEHRMAMKDADGRVAAAMSQMQQQMANMPAEQRKMIEKMMADQGVAMGPKGNTIKVCLTREDADRDVLPQREGCTQTVDRSANVWKVSFQCKGNPPSSGEGVVRLLGPTAYDGEFKMNTVVDGKPERMVMSQSGKWLAADCGALGSKKKP